MPAFRGDANGERARIAIVVSRFNGTVTDRLLAGARACLLEHGVSEKDIDIVSVPGAWELPAAAQFAAQRKRYSAVVAIGCIVRGDTPHFDFIASAAAHGLTRVGLDAGIPVAFGVLTTDDLRQAEARAGGAHGNKGWEAAAAALEMADLRARLET